MTDDNEKQESPESGSKRSAPDGSKGISGPSKPDAEAQRPAPQPPAAEAAPPEAKEADSKPAVPKPPPKKPAPKKPKGPQKQPYSGPLVDALHEKFPGQLVDSYTFVGARQFVIKKDRLIEVMSFLRQNDIEAFDFLSDETATHWPDEQEFELVYVLFSFESNQRVMVKARTKEWETIESLVAIWPGANWLEREIYDMFGVRFVNHPNMKRILLPEDWVGFPLRKDYDLRLQDVDWVRKHLGIESGQRFYVDKATHDDT